MKKKSFQIITFFLLITVLYSCKRKENDFLTPPNNRPVYTVQVEDATEAELLHQQLKLPIVRVALPLVYFYGDDKELLKRLSDLGYGEPRQQNPDEVYIMHAKLTGKYDEAELKRSGVVLLNREKDHAIVYGSIASLRKLDNLIKLDYEPRPREVEIKVNRREDIQTVAGIQVDIFGTFPGNDSTYVIQGAAWDNQIDQLRRLNFTVTIK